MRRWHFQGISSSTDTGAVSELLAEFLRGLLPALANLAAVDNHIMFETNAINFD
jgi:hypothetical protein